MRRLLVILLLASVLPLCTMSCKNDGYADEKSVRLEFSADTVCFDTVFTTVGTIPSR